MKKLSHVVVNCYQKIIYVKDVSCDTQLSFAKPITSAPSVTLDIPIGERLHKFWETWKLTVPVQK